MDVDVERGQLEIIEYFSKHAAVLEGSPSSLAAFILEATSHPSLFVFSEILSLPNLAMLEGTRYSTSVNVLRLFAYGTWSDYICNVCDLPTLLPDQVRKLKQLTVLTLAETDKVLPYDQLMQEIDVSNVRELEDFLINECMYAGIIRGKLDQLRRHFEVRFAAGRDIRPEQLGNMIQTLDNWLDNSDNLQHLNQESIKWADTMNAVNKKHRVEIENKVNDVTTPIKAKLELQGHEGLSVESGGMMDYEDRVQPKRRRQLIS